MNTRGLRGPHQLKVLVTHELDLRGMTNVLDVVTILELSFDAQYEDPAIHDVAGVRADGWKQTPIKHLNYMRLVSLKTWEHDPQSLALLEYFNLNPSPSQLEGLRIGQ